MELQVFGAAVRISVGKQRRQEDQLEYDLKATQAARAHEVALAEAQAKAAAGGAGLDLGKLLTEARANMAAGKLGKR